MTADTFNGIFSSPHFTMHNDVHAMPAALLPPLFVNIHPLHRIRCDADKASVINLAKATA